MRIVPIEVLRRPYNSFALLCVYMTKTNECRVTRVGSGRVGPGPDETDYVAISAKTDYLRPADTTNANVWHDRRGGHCVHMFRVDHCR